MKFTAYASRADGPHFSVMGRDEAAGILGTLTPNAAPPVVVADSLEALRREANAYLLKEPDALLYLTDADRRVYEALFNEKHHAAKDLASRRHAILTALLVFGATSLIGGFFGSSGAGALLAFAISSALYGFFLRAKFLNEIEGALFCEILLIIILISIPGLLRILRAFA